MQWKTRSLLPWYWARPSIWTRRGWLAVAHVTGVVEDWLWRDGRARVLSLALPVALVVAGVPVWQAVLGYVGAAVILWALFRAHTRVVVESFDDYTTPV